MKRAAILLTALAALWAAPTHAQTDFLTLQENVDASDTALMCPTRADNYVDCADAGTLPVPSVRGGRPLGSRGWPRLIMGTTATVAAKLAGADGRTIYICGLMARGGIVAARASTPVTGTRDGIIFPNTRPSHAPEPA